MKQNKYIFKIKISKTMILIIVNSLINKIALIKIYKNIYSTINKKNANNLLFKLINFILNHFQIMMIFKSILTKDNKSIKVHLMKIKI